MEDKMKIERLFTLSQFIDLLSLKETPDPYIHWRYTLINSYNEFLKQPLIIDMFIDKDKAIFNDVEWFKEEEIGFIGNNVIDMDCYMLDGINTLYDLSQYTKGELKLKNIKL